MGRIDSHPGRAGDQLAKIAEGINAEYARFCELLVTADVDQEWLADGAPSLVQWMTARFGFDARFGRRLAKLAHQLADLPELRKRFSAGDLSLDAVEMLAEVATPDTELDLLEEGADGDLHDIARLASRTNPPTIEEAAKSRSDEWLSAQWNLQRNKMAINGQLTGVGAQLVEDRLVEAAQQMPKNPDTDHYDEWSKRMADALVEICATDAEDRGPVPTVTLHADLEVLVSDTGVAELSNGPVIPSEMARMLCCDSAVEAAITNDRRVVGVGRKTRQIPGWLRRQVEARDHHCRFPGCGRTAFIQIHHIQPWSQGGATDLDNLILLCWWHHVFMHENTWHITTDLNHKFVFRRPDWSIYPPRPT